MCGAPPLARSFVCGPTTRPPGSFRSWPKGNPITGRPDSICSRGWGRGTRSRRSRWRPFGPSGIWEGASSTLRSSSSSRTASWRSGARPSLACAHSSRSIWIGSSSRSCSRAIRPLARPSARRSENQEWRKTGRRRPCFSAIRTPRSDGRRRARSENWDRARTRKCCCRSSPTPRHGFGPMRSCPWEGWGLAKRARRWRPCSRTRAPP